MMVKSSNINRTRVQSLRWDLIVCYTVLDTGDRLKFRVLRCCVKVPTPLYSSRQYSSNKVVLPMPRLSSSGIQIVVDNVAVRGNPKELMT